MEEIKAFVGGEKVIHKHLGLGTYIKPDWSSDESCYVEFTDEYGDSECKRVSIDCLTKVES